MSKSRKRVERALAEAGLAIAMRETGESARTAQLAADEIGVEVDRIAKSIIVQGAESGEVVLFITAGGNQVDTERAAALMGEPTTRADAALVRTVTGFAIGGVAPVGHLSPIRAFFDPRLSDFPTIWAAAGTPHHVFEIAPETLVRISGANVAAFTG